MIKFKDILRESEDLDTLVNRKLLNIVAKRFDLNFNYNDYTKPIISQIRREGIIEFMDEIMALDYQKIAELCWLIFINGSINYLTDPIKTDETFYVYEVGYYGDVEGEEVEVDDDCPQCDGYGTQNDDCQTCQGAGEYDYGEGTEECEDCGGGGEVENDCPECDGSGVAYFNQLEYYLTDNTVVFYSNEPNLDTPIMNKTNFELWYEENEALLIPMNDKWEDTESSFHSDDLEDKEGTVSVYYPQGDIHFENARYRTYFRNIIEHG